jgi:hypothetical protein
MHPLCISLMDFVLDSIDAYTMKFVIEPLTDHILILDDFLVLFLIFILYLRLFLIEAFVLSSPVIHTQSGEQYI